jgi:FdhD protein
MVQKAVVFGAGLLAAVSAPTSFAIEVAKENNLALAGYVRNEKMVVYSFPERFSQSVL